MTKHIVHHKTGYQRYFVVEYEPLSLEAALPSVDFVLRTLAALRPLIRPLCVELGVNATDGEGVVHRDVLASPSNRWLYAAAPEGVRRRDVERPFVEHAEVITSDHLGEWFRRGLETECPPPYRAWWSELTVDETLVRLPAELGTSLELDGRAAPLVRDADGVWAGGSLASDLGAPMTMDFSLDLGTLQLRMTWLWSVWTRPGSPGRALLEKAAKDLVELGWDDLGFAVEPEGAPETKATFEELDLGEQLRAGMGDEVRRGTLGGERALVTLAGGRPTDVAGYAEAHRLDVDGIAPLLWCGDPGPSSRYDAALIEVEPQGQPASDLGVLDETALVTIGSAAARVLARAHDAGLVVGGVRPELLYVDRGELAGLVPRGPGFVAAAMPNVSGFRAYRVPFVATEVLTTGSAAAASDVFALCATLSFLGTGEHPFGDTDEIAGLVSSLLGGNPPRDWPGTPHVGELLVSGLVADAGARPSAQELATQLDAVGWL